MCILWLAQQTAIETSTVTDRVRFSIKAPARNLKAPLLIEDILENQRLAPFLSVDEDVLDEPVLDGSDGGTGV